MQGGSSCRAVGVRSKGAPKRTASGTGALDAMSYSIYAPRSNQKIEEKDSVAICQPTILQIVGE